MIEKLKITVLTVILILTVINIQVVAVTYKPGYEIIVDDSGSGFTSIGSFKASEASSAYNGTVRTVNIEQGETAEAAWKPEIPLSGYYRVYIEYPETENAAEHVTVQIDYNGGTNTYKAKKLNQNINTDCWVYLGTYYMLEGRNNAVKLIADEQGIASADAVKFVLNSDNIENGKTMGNVTEAVEYNENEAVLVQDMETGDNYLTVKGERYDIKGVCQSDLMTKTAAAGGNTIRTYSAVKYGNVTKKILDEAQSLGIKVVLGLSLSKETDSFNYKDNYDVFETNHFGNFKIQINEFKNHPALLMWAVGNEVDSLNSTSGEKIYDAINDVAEYIKAVDPYHPVTTVHAGSAPVKFTNVMSYVPCVDIVSTNTYKGIPNAYNNIIADALWQGPYMITEYAINQPSEEISAGNYVFDDTVIERADYEKAQMYYDRYMNYIDSNKSKCIGSFAFASYGAYRGTHTWYNIYSEDYMKTPVYDALYRVWNNGNERENTVPTVTALKLEEKTAAEGIVLKCGGSAVLEMEVSDKENDTLTYKFEVRKSDMNTNNAPVTDVSFTADASDSSKVIVSNLPDEEGIYRLFVYVYDGNDNMGYGNIPFKIKKSYTEGKLSKEIFSNISALGDSYTTPTENGFCGTWKKDAALTTTSLMQVSNIGGYNVSETAPLQAYRNLYNELQTPIDMDSDTVYYAKWIQGYTSVENNQYIKVGFGKKGDTTTELSTVFIVKPDSSIPSLGIKADNSVSYSGEYVNSGSLYNVFFRIDANPTGNDIIMVKVWPVNCEQPYYWTYSVEKEITGEYALVFMQSNCLYENKAYFGDFSLESFSGEDIIQSVYEEVGEYLAGGTEPKELSDLSGFTAYEQIKDLMENKDCIYIKETALYADVKRISYIPETATDNMSVTVVLGNDNSNVSVCQNDIYIVCYDDRGTIISADVICNKSINEPEKEFSFNVSSAAKAVKLFCWNKEQHPVCVQTQILQTGIINY